MILPSLRKRIQGTTFVDTHEHLLEEKTRLAGPGAHHLQPCDDAALLFYHYAGDDLWSAGLSPGDRRQFFSPTMDPGDKWPVLAPTWQRARNTGYLRAVAESVHVLFGVELLDANAFVRVTEAMRAGPPGLLPGGPAGGREGRGLPGQLARGGLLRDPIPRPAATGPEPDPLLDRDRRQDGGGLWRSERAAHRDT